MALADTARLIATLELQDKMGPGIASASRGLDKLEGRLGRIGGLAAQGAKNAAANLAAIGVVAAGVVATQVFAGIRSLEELERVTEATEGVITSTGGAAGVTAQQVRDLAQALESVTTADDKVIQSGENLLLTFTNIGKDTFPQATKAMVDLGIAMAQGDVENADFKASAIQIGKALNDPIKGITALTRVGVSFTEQQKEQIEQLVKAGDVMGAQKIILGELEREFGGAGAAAGRGFGADIRRVKDAVEDAQQALATGFLPLIRKVADVLSKELAKPSTIAAIKSFGESLAGGLEQLIKVAGNIPWSSIGDAMKIAGTGAKALFDAFVSLPPWVQTAVLTGWGLNKLTGGALGGIVGELGKGLIKGVLGLTAGVVNVKGAVVNTVGGGVPGVAPTGGGGVSNVFKFLGGALLVTGTVALATEVSGLLDPKHQTGDPAHPIFRGTNIPTEQIANLERAAARLEERIAGGETGMVEDQLKAVVAEIAKLREDVKAQTAALKPSGAPPGVTGGKDGEAAAAFKKSYDALERSRASQASGMEKVRAASAAAAAASRAAAAAIRDKDMSPIIRNTVNVTVPVTVRAISQKQKISARLGFVAS